MTRDYEKLINLRKSLAVYRLVFGQSRQEDLVQFLNTTLPEDEVERVAASLQLDLSPPRTELE